MLAEGSKYNHFASGFDYTFGFNFFYTIEQLFKENKSATTINVKANETLALTIRATEDTSTTQTTGTRC